MKSFHAPNIGRYYELPDFFVATSPKAGSTSIARTFAEQDIRHTMQHLVSKSDKPVILFLRHPLERLVSAFHMMRSRNSGIPQNFPDFVDKVLKKERYTGDKHWLPQADLHYQGRQFLITECWPFDKINELWPDIVGKGQLKWLNRGEKTDWELLWDELSPTQQQQIIEYYADDLRLYEKALARWRNWHTHQS